MGEPTKILTVQQRSSPRRAEVTRTHEVPDRSADPPACSIEVQVPEDMEGVAQEFLSQADAIWKNLVLVPWCERSEGS